MVLTDPESAGVIISNIDGLGAEEASIFTTDLASIDGALFNSARLPKRSINLTVIPITTKNGTIEDHRLEMYKYFPIKQKVTLRFETDKRLAEIQGYVETNQPTIFSDKESIAITIVCPDPYFYDVKKYNGITTTIFTSVQKAFQFKYANDISTALSNIQQEFNAKYIDQEPERVTVVINSTADLLDKEIEIEPINGVSIGTNIDQIWETSKEMSLINNDKIIFIPHLPVGSSKTYLQNGSNKYEVLTADGHDFNTSTSQGRLKTTNDSEDILVLKYSDRRIYVQKIITKENDQKYWKKTIFGNYAQALEQLLRYEGDVQIGALFTINIYGALRNFRIYNIDTRTYMTFDDEKINALTGAYLQDGDLIELNTIKGNKYVRLKRGNEYYSLLNCINNDADWFQLNVGDNIYTYLANDNSLLSMTVQYRTALIGI